MIESYTPRFKLRGSPSPRLVDMAGRRIGNLLVIERVQNRGRWAAWRCRCDLCGREVVRRGIELRHGTVDCGKHRAGRTSAALRSSYGHSTTNSPSYRSWARMVQRYRSQVDPAWHRFAPFLAAMGERPAGTHLRRLDPAQPYQPGNVVWASGGDQPRE